jgi:hypothetical protein
LRLAFSPNFHREKGTQAEIGEKTESKVLHLSFDYISLKFLKLGAWILVKSTHELGQRPLIVC